MPAYTSIADKQTIQNAREALFQAKNDLAWDFGTEQINAALKDGSPHAIAKALGDVIAQYEDLAFYDDPEDSERRIHAEEASSALDELNRMLRPPPPASRMKKQQQRAAAYKFRREHAYRLYEHDGISRAKAKPVVEKFLDKGFELVDIGGGDIVWRKTFTTGKVTPAKVKASFHKFDLRIEVLGRDGELVKKMKAPGTITVERGPGHGLYFMVSDIGLALDTLEVFNLESLTESERRTNPEGRLLRSSRRLANP